MQSQFLGLGGALDVSSLQRQKEKERQPEDVQALQARVAQLEGQVSAEADLGWVGFVHCVVELEGPPLSSKLSPQDAVVVEMLKIKHGSVWESTFFSHVVT